MQRCPPSAQITVGKHLAAVVTLQLENREQMFTCGYRGHHMSLCDRHTNCITTCNSKAPNAVCISATVGHISSGYAGTCEDYRVFRVGMQLRAGART
mmetsp:Transcript_5859/g.9078  ORF Transcript_5859/g.9078 Transcript_5859/m.9078 type:complete len:97 (-) Transcript_5859:281-571(-)